MKVLKILLAILILSTVIFTSLSCSSGSNTLSTTTTKNVTVKTGNIMFSITGTGNLAYSTAQDMAFEVPGYVESVSVKAGDTVTRDQEIAKVDTSTWETTLKGYQSILTKAQRDLSNAKEDLSAAERAVSDAQKAVSAKELDLQTVEYVLSQIADVKDAQTVVDNTKNLLDAAKSLRAVGDTNTDVSNIKYLQEQYDNAVARLNRILQSTDTTVSTTVALQIAKDQLAVETAKNELEKVQIAIDTAKTTVNNKKLDLAEAQQAVTDAQSTLDKANSLSPIVKAPFAGIITNINVKGGDEVFKGSIAATIADPSQFQADIMVTENDIYSVKLNEDAIVSLDALSGLTYPAKVTYIAPTATVSSGVVNYSVTVMLTSLQPVSSSQIPVSSISLKKGLTATVKIISEQASNVLLIPSKAIKQQGPDSVVQVIKGTSTETRTVKTGITDGTNTEITEGLSAGEEITYTVSSSNSSSTTKNNTQQGGIPGIGGGGPPPGGF